MDDCIYRQAAIKAVYAIHTVDTEFDAALLGRLDVRYVLEALPSADVEPIRHGRWDTEILTDACGCKHAYYACSVCGISQNWDEFDYCPNCGAMMDGEQDE